MKSIRLFFSLSLFFLLLTGCSMDTLKQFVKAPEVKDVQLASFSPKDNRIVFKVDLYNPNQFELPISGFSGQIWLNKIAVGSLDAASKETLAPLAIQSIDVPIALNADALMKVAKSILFSMQASYDFKGFIKTSIVPVPFVKNGELSAKDIVSAFL